MYIQGGSPTIVVNGVFFSPFFMAFKKKWVDPWGEISPVTDWSYFLTPVVTGRGPNLGLSKEV